MRAALLLGAAALAANAQALRSFSSPYPPPSGLVAEDAVLNASLISLGMRRLAADIAFVRLLIYYGTHESDLESQEGHEHHGWGHEEFGRGAYPELKARAIRILALDPYFDYIALYASGALAFNLKRPAEALEVLDEALRLRPRHWKFLAYVAAIGFDKKGDAARVIAELLPLLGDPDAPTMLKNMVAFLLERQGRREEAVRLYREILDSRDESYHHLARRALQRLEK